MISKLAGLNFLILTIIFSGCFKEPESEKINAEKRGYEVIPVIDETWLEEKIKNRNGRILFVNVWATWCQPCVEEFPDLVKIYSEYKDADFEFLSISVDLQSEINSNVKPFLIDQKADFPVVVADETKAEQIINILSSEWSGAIPATFIYDKKSEQKDFIIGARDYEYFKKSIDSVKEL
jgi:thiol-disulfide isomerase/thioredoxin